MPGADTDLGVRKTTLPNGVRVLSEAIPQFGSATIGVWVENGSRYETAAQNGISHFLEHVFFKGTENRSAQEIAQAIDGVGGVLNAFTDREYTCYHAKVLKEDLPLAVDVLSDVLLRSRFPEDEIERERTVVLSEISESEDAPDQLVHLLFDEELWPDHPLARPIAGTQETVRSIGRQDFIDFIGERYRPDRIIVAAAGAVDHEWLVERIGEEFGSRTGKTPEPTLTTPEMERGMRVHQKELEQVQLLAGVPGLHKGDPRRFAAFVLNTAFGDGMSSRLFQEVRENRGLAYSVSSFFASFLKAGYMAIYCGLAPESVGEALDVICEQMRLIRSDGLHDDELQRAKSQIRGGMLLSLESSGSRMSRMAINEIYYGRQLSTDEVSASIEAVGHDQIREVADTLFGVDRLSVTLLGDMAQAPVSEERIALS